MILFAPWLDRDDYQQEAAIARWQGKNVRLHLIDITRKATHHRAAQKVALAELNEETVGGPSDSTVDAVLTRERFAETVDGLKKLPGRQARCLFRQSLGQTFPEIAAAEGLTYSQVDMAVFRGRAALRKAA